MAISYDGVGRYTPGGRNVMAEKYISGGKLPYSDRPLWLGVSEPDWYGAGKKIGQGSADMIASCSDYWWRLMCSTRGYKDTLHAINQYIKQVELLDETQIELLKGINEGAAEETSKSEFSNVDSCYYADSFIRVFAASIFDSWIWGDPDSYGSPDAVPNTLAEEFISGNMSANVNGCNSVAVLRGGNALGHTISSQVRHTQQAGLCYQASTVYHSKNGDFNDFWTVGNVPSITGLLICNNKGVSISHHFGGSTTAKSLEYGCYGGAYGVPWPNMLFYAIKHANTADEAIDLLVHGSEMYRTATGRKTVLHDGTWNWMVCDNNSVSVLEISPDRYAIRHPGEFTENWDNKDYIVCANHFLCDYSYDENENRTDIPMTVFNTNPTSERRFWTLMWEMRDFQSKIDVHTLEYIFSQTYLRDKETGAYEYVMTDDNGNTLTMGQVFACVQGTLTPDNGLSNGTNAAKIAVLNGKNTSCHFCLGNPKDWSGEWDEFCFV